MSSNFINNLKGLIDFSGVNPQLMATPADVAKVTTPQYSMATPSEVASLTGGANDTISLEQAVNELPRVSKSGNITGGKAGQKLTATGNTNKVIDTTKDLNTLFNNAVTSGVKGTDKTKIMNLLKTAARPTSKIGVRALGPIGAIAGAGATIKDVYDLGKAIVDNYRVNKDYDEKAYQEAQLRQERRAAGASNDEIDAEIAQLRAQKDATDAEVARQQALTDAAKASYEQALAMQGNGGMDNVPPPTTPIIPNADGGEPEQPEQPVSMSLPQTRLDYTNLNGLGDYSLPVGTSDVMTGGAAGFDPLAEKFTQDILGANEGVNREQIMQQLKDNLAKVREVQARDPRYQGEILTPDNPYSINTNKLQNLQDFAALANRVRQLQGKPMLNDFAGEEVANAQRLYQQQLANQAGVPYEDYIAATMEARENELLNLKAEQENILRQQAMQATNMKEKIAYMQKAKELESEFNKAIMENRIKGQYDLQKQLLSNRGTLDVAQTNVAGDIAIQNMKAQDPARLLGGYASLGEALAFTPEMYRGQYLYNLPQSIKMQMGIQSLSPEELAQLFAGRPSQVMQQQARPTLSDRFNNWLNPNREQ